MFVLAHRANLDGPVPATENSLAMTLSALEAGFGIETDLRRDSMDRCYIAHDPSGWTDATDFAAFARVFRAHPDRPIALNVKELGYEAELLDRQLAGDFGARSFLFDFELLEPQMPGAAQRKIRSLPVGERAVLAARVSDRGESLDQCLSIPAQVVWLDEFDSPWATAETVAALRAAGRQIFAVSPELHGFDREARLRRWSDFAAWRVDGVCTDFAWEARKFFATLVSP
jgi:glycerophosphoryl diester phosphodiesterase